MFIFLSGCLRLDTPIEGGKIGLRPLQLVASSCMRASNTSRSRTPNSFAVSANITAANDAGHTQSAVELRILSAQLEWIVDATRSSYRKRTHVGRFRRQN
jgi:hypothetical protein